MKDNQRTCGNCAAWKKVRETPQVQFGTCKGINDDRNCNINAYVDKGDDCFVTIAVDITTLSTFSCGNFREKKQRSKNT